MLTLNRTVKGALIGKTRMNKTYIDIQYQQCQPVRSHSFNSASLLLWSQFDCLFSGRTGDAFCLFVEWEGYSREPEHWFLPPYRQQSSEGEATRPQDDVVGDF